jgi:hypothetical protein
MKPGGGGDKIPGDLGSVAKMKEEFIALGVPPIVNRHSKIEGAAKDPLTLSSSCEV